MRKTRKKESRRRTDGSTIGREILRDIREAEGQIDRGEGIPHGRAKAWIPRKLKRR